MKTFTLDIYTPYKHYLRTEASYLSIAGEEYVYGIMPKHIDMIAKVKISKMKVTTSEGDTYYAIGGGIIKVDQKQNTVTLLLDSIESKEEIDIARANLAKQRAENYIANSEKYDLERAKRALARALTRIDLYHS